MRKHPDPSPKLNTEKLATAINKRSRQSRSETARDSGGFEIPSRVHACAKDSSSRSTQRTGKQSCQAIDASEGNKPGSRGASPAAVGAKTDRRKRTTHELSEGGALEVLAAVQEAVLIGLAPNVFLTINLEQGQVADCVRVIGKFLTYCRQWIRSRGCNTAYVWCQERGPITGQHVHILLHVPPALWTEMMKKHRGWLKRCGAISTKGLIHSRPIGKSRLAAFGDQASRRDYRRNLCIVVDYMLKEVDEQSRARIGTGRFAIAIASEVIGKRSGTSQNVGKKARSLRDRVGGPATPWELTLGDDLGTNCATRVRDNRVRQETGVAGPTTGPNISAIHPSSAATLAEAEED